MVSSTSEANTLYCGVLEHARELAKQLAYTKEDGERAPMEGYMPVCMAEARHENTNYDDLLHELKGHCLAWTREFEDRERVGTCLAQQDPSDGECRLMRQAYWELKEAANEFVDGRGRPME
jgi:transcription elongation GreA/GreB family factor